MTTTRGRRHEAIFVAASAGGVEALLAILPELPVDFPLPLVAVVHLPADEPSGRLPELFGPRCRLPVCEPLDKERIVGGRVYFAPAGYHLLVEADRSFALSLDPPVHFARPSADVLLESAAEAYGAGAVGVVLSGANADGAAGLRAVRERGGLTIVQDPQTAAARPMPEAAIGAARPEHVLRLHDIGRFLAALGAPDPSLGRAGAGPG